MPKQPDISEGLGLYDLFVEGTDHELNDAHDDDDAEDNR
jgi:hypothetical protein